LLQIQLPYLSSVEAGYERQILCSRESRRSSHENPFRSSCLPITTNKLIISSSRRCSHVWIWHNRRPTHSESNGFVRNHHSDDSPWNGTGQS
jgi:hypothetical protein